MSTTKEKKRVEPLPPLKISKVSSFMRGGELSSRLLDTLTFKYQKSLPSLPVPKLEDTLERFLKKASPLISKEELEKAKESVERFKSGSGKSLQEELEKRAEELRGKGSYVEEFWYNGYLAPKESVVLNLNPFFVLEDDPTPARNEQIKRGASLLFSAVRFVWKLWNEELVPDTWRKTPLDMSQYCRLFGSCRIPKKGDDEHVTFPKSRCRHVVVVAESQFFCFDVLDEDGNISVSEKSLRQVLSAILDDASSEDRLCSAQSAVGVFTTCKRSEWALRRTQLAEISRNNATALETIDTAMFVMCLDNTSPSSVEALAANALHGSYVVLKTF